VWGNVSSHPKIRNRPHVLFEIFNEPTLAFDNTEDQPWKRGKYPNASTVFGDPVGF
jgi:hypothetical protein